MNSSEGHTIVPTHRARQAAVFMAEHPDATEADFVELARHLRVGVTLVDLYRRAGIGYVRGGKSPHVCDSMQLSGWRAFDARFRKVTRRQSAHGFASGNL